MIEDIDFRPVIEKISLSEGNGRGYSAHVAEIIHEIINSFIKQLYLSQESGIDTGDLYQQADLLINDWLKSMRAAVNRREQSVSWAKNLLVLLVKTLDATKDWHPYLLILNKQLDSLLPKHLDSSN